MYVASGNFDTQAALPPISLLANYCALGLLSASSSSSMGFHSLLPWACGMQFSRLWAAAAEIENANKAVMIQTFLRKIL
jgi:hypothetical protein